MLAFEAELAHLPRSLIAALWEAFYSADSKEHRARCLIIRHSALYEWERTPYREVRPPRK
jgi:hypothetical protein